MLILFFSQSSQQSSSSTIFPVQNSLLIVTQAYNVFPLLFTKGWSFIHGQMQSYLVSFLTHINYKARIIILILQTRLVNFRDYMICPKPCYYRVADLESELFTYPGNSLSFFYFSHFPPFPLCFYFLILLGCKTLNKIF